MKVGGDLMDKRFWQLRGKQYSVSDGGYLTDPDQEYGSVMNPGLVTLESLRDRPCAVLLGESGMGKSTALRVAYGADPLSHTGNVTTSYVDLGLIDSGVELRNELFDEKIFDELQESGGVLDLVLDSLDECPVANAADIIVEEIGKRKKVLQFLKLRIACRSSYWPMHVESALSELFGVKDLVYELCPLRRVDVERFAESKGLDPEAFIQAVGKQDIVPFAVRPVTLNFLVGVYASDPVSFSVTSQVQLYRQGMERLATDENKRRNENPHGTPVSPGVRLLVAERLSVISVLSGKRKLCRWPSDDGQDSYILSYTDATAALGSGVDLCGFPRSDAFLAVFDSTAFFAASVSDSVTWAHASYADFLAAKYLVDYEVSSEKITDLLFSGGLQGRIVRQLRPLAEWLAAMSPELRDVLSRKNPELAIKKDPTQPMSAAEKRGVIEALLRQHSQPDVLYVDWDLAARLGKMEHPGICEQLGPYLTDPHLPLAARELAVLCVREMRLRDLSALCLRIALDPSEPESLRRVAIEAIAVAGTQETRKQLRPLIVASERPSRESLDVFGAALGVLWRDELTSKELFDSLPVPRDSMLGDYEYFLDFTLGPTLLDEDLSYALDWVSRLDETWLESYGIHSLIDTVIRRAWQLALATSGQFPLTEFAAAYWNLASKRNSALLDHQKKQERDFFLMGPAALRRRVALAALSHGAFSEDAAFHIMHCDTPMVDSGDFEWVLDVIVESSRPNERASLARLASYLFRRDSVANIDAVLRHKDIAEIHDRFKDLIDPIRLQSAEAGKMRTEYDSWQEIEARQADQERQRQEREMEKPTLSTISQVAAAILADGKKTTFQRWYLFYQAVLAASDERAQYVAYSLDIVDLSGWHALDECTQTAATKCALAYLSEVNPNVDEGISTEKWTLGASYGLSCLVLTARRIGVDAAELPDQLAERWLPVLLSYPVNWIETEQATLTDILTTLAARCPDILSRTTGLILNYYASVQHVFTTVLDRLELVWSEEVSRLVFATMRTTEIRVDLFSWCLKALCAKGVQGTREIALEMVKQGGQENSTPKAKEKAIIAAMVLAQTCTDWWVLLWELLGQNPGLGKDFIQLMSKAYPHETLNPLDSLSEDQLATLYMWIFDTFPGMSDEMELGAHFVTPIEEVQEMTRAILNRLGKGTNQASVEALTRIRDHYSEKTWLRRVVSESEDNYAASAWLPPSVDQLIKLLDEPGARYVADEDQLLEVINKQIEILQQRLHGETPACWLLWNEFRRDRRDVWRPKEETRISDWVKVELEQLLVQRSIIVNREVEIRRGADSETPGQRTDIKVDTVSEGVQASHVEVIIEVKGCWNPKLLTDMKVQLADRYLADNKCHHGIYLVAWFNWQNWDRGDYRRRQAFKHKRDRLEQQLLGQAEALRAEGYFISPRFLDFIPPNASQKA